MICDPTYPETLAIQFAYRSGKVGMKLVSNIIADERKSILRAEDNVHEVETQRLGHSGDYISGLQPSSISGTAYLGLRPRLVCHRTFGPGAKKRRAVRGKSHA
jgi:hypothetical protein